MQECYDPKTVLECWGCLCHYKMVGFQTEETDPDMLLHYRLYYFWNDEEDVFQCSATGQDILDLGYYGFLGNVESTSMESLS